MSQIALRSPLVLGLVCVVCAAGGLALTSPEMGLGWDEIVYVSQYAPSTPAAFFSAPRSRGVALLVAPVVMVTDSTVLLRYWLSGAAATALFLGYLPWLRLVPRPAVVLGAVGGYATLWITLFYAGAAMPNHYSAMAGVSAVGWYLWVARGGRGRLALAGSLAVAGLVRPGDAFWLVLPLIVATLAVPAWRRADLFAVIVGGSFAGVLAWLVEAHLRFGGILERVHRAGEIQGGTGLTFSLRETASALDGPLLCRPCTGDTVAAPALLWWCALPVLVIAGVWAARRARLSALAWLPCAVGVSLAVTYILLIDYSAPRFLLPTYALLALPAVWGLLAVIDVVRGRLGRRRPRLVLGAALGAALAGHLAVQVLITAHWADSHRETRRDWERIARTVRAAGIRPPCLLTGTEAIPIAYYAGCASAAPSGNNATHTRDHLIAETYRVPSALLTKNGAAPPAWAATWRHHAVPGTGTDSTWVVHVPEWTPLRAAPGVADRGTPPENPTR
ncbi:hypothetical protein [Embleya sp. NPDC001921]